MQVHPLILGLLSLLFVLVPTIGGVPTHFVAGDDAVRFSRHAAADFIRYGWDTLPEPGFQRGNTENSLFSADEVTAIDTVPESLGLIAGGTFTTITDAPASRIAYFDGERWCAIKEGLSDTVRAVNCETGTDCYAVGDFMTVLNVGNGTVNKIVHYRLVDGEWVWVNDLVDWAVFGEGDEVPYPGEAIKLEIATSSESIKYFFVLTTDGIIWRGSSRDDGWVHFSDNLDEDATDFHIVGGVMYVVGDNLLQAQTSDLFVPDKEDVQFFHIFNLTALDPDRLFSGFSRIWAMSGNRRFMTCRWRENKYDSALNRWYICEQEEEGRPVPLGLPFFGPGWNRETDPFTDLFELPNGEPLAVGWFEGANWWESQSGLGSGFDRAYDSVFYTAAFNYSSGDWYQPFGGGLEDLPLVAGTTGLDNQYYYFAHIWLEWAWDVLSHGAVWYDNDAALRVANRRPWFPLIHHALFQPNRDARVRVVLPRGDGQVYVAGRFAFVGREKRGSIFLTTPVRTAAEFTTESVGGGLWDLMDDDDDRQHADEFLQGGHVRALTNQGADLYAAGDFTRTLSGKCLSNIAVLRVGDEEWQSLGGGCDDTVYAMVWYRDILYIGGEFSKCGGKRMRNVGAWTGSEWMALNTGVDGGVYTMEVYRGELIVGGEFDTAGGLYTRGIAAWNGVAWRAIQNTCNQPTCEYRHHPVFKVEYVEQLKVVGGRLYALAGSVMSEYMDGREPGPRPSCYNRDNCVYREGHNNEDATLVSWDGSVWRKHTDSLWGVESIYINGTQLVFVPEDEFSDFFYFDIPKNNLLAQDS